MKEEPPMRLYFTVAVKRRFFGWKKYRCTHFVHETELNGYTIEPRLRLTLQSGAKVFVSRIDQKDWKLGADYQRFMAERRALMAQHIVETEAASPEAEQPSMH